MWGKKNQDREPEVVHVIAAHDGRSPRYLGESKDLTQAEIDAAYHAYDNPNVPISVESYVDYPVEWIKGNKK